MFNAVYYPHSTIRDELFLKNSLLLWDQLECIVPPFGFRSHRFGDSAADEAVELLVRNHTPTVEEKQRLHDGIKSMLASGVPAWLRFELSAADIAALSTEQHSVGESYLIYPQKLSYETWELLRDAGLVIDTRRGDFGVSWSLGLLMMSLLADFRAGTQKQTITDRSTAYDYLSKCTAASMGAELSPDSSVVRRSEIYSQLVPVAFRVFNTDDIPLRSLVEWRRREAEEGDESELKLYRHNYISDLNQYMKQHVEPHGSDIDRVEMLKHYRSELGKSAGKLRRMLTGATRQALFSKEVVATMVVGTSLVLPQVAPSLSVLHPAAVPVGFAAAYQVHRTLLDARRKAFENSPVAWLYQTRTRPWNRFTQPLR